jgi:hypothetical protein
MQAGEKWPEKDLTGARAEKVLDSTCGQGLNCRLHGQTSLLGIRLAANFFTSTLRGFT